MTSSPACASGRAATPPAAPRPTMTTSVRRRSTGMIVAVGSQSRARRLLLREHGEVVRRLMRRGRPCVEALIARRHGQADARVADEIPAYEIGVAAVVRVAERALNRVRQQEVEEDPRAREARRRTRLELQQNGV